MDEMNSGAGEHNDDTNPLASSSASASEPMAKPASTLVKLSLTGNGLAFTRDIDEGVMLEVMRLVMTGVDNSGSSAASTQGEREGEQSAGRKQALSEYYRRVAPKKYPEKLTVIAAYLQEILERQSFSADDLRGHFRSVNEPPPANLSRDIRLAVGNGWIADELDSPGQFYVTQTGIDAVKSAFSADGGRRGTRTRKRRRQSVGAESAAESSDE